MKSKNGGFLTSEIRPCWHVGQLMPREREAPERCALRHAGRYCNQHAGKDFSVIVALQGSEMRGMLQQRINRLGQAVAGD